MNCSDSLALTGEGQKHAGLLLHYRDAKGGLAYEQIVAAIANVEHAFDSVRGLAIPLNPYAWDTRRSQR